MRMKIGEFSATTGWSIDTIRFYESKGLLKPKRDESSRYRYYSKDDLEIAEGIQVGRALGFTLAEIQVGLQAHQAGELTQELKQRIVGEKLLQIEQKVAELQTIQKYLQAKLDWLKSGEVGDAPPHLYAHLTKLKADPITGSAANSKAD